jgi:catechol 2,3-dioxygenase-like lactoylglutathione lyase family enzyme
MQVKGIDHVNIATADLDGTAHFYESLLGFSPGPTPNSPDGSQARWLHDATGRPIIHLMMASPEKDHGHPTTGAIDHVAIACEGFHEILQRCEEMGLPYQANDRQYFGLRQIFATDPNNVKLELNFQGD